MPCYYLIHFTDGSDRPHYSTMLYYQHDNVVWMKPAVLHIWAISLVAGCDVMLLWSQRHQSSALWTIAIQLPGRFGLTKCHANAILKTYQNRYCYVIKCDNMQRTHQRYVKQWSWISKYPVVRLYFLLSGFPDTKILILHEEAQLDTCLTALPNANIQYPGSRMEWDSFIHPGTKLSIKWIIAANVYPYETKIVLDKIIPFQSAKYKTTMNCWTRCCS